jgi:hypothetical protein
MSDLKASCSFGELPRHLIFGMDGLGTCAKVVTSHSSNC